MSPALSRIFVVITDFNGWAQTRACLERLRESVFRDFATLVVDHGTTEETRRALEAGFPEVIRVRASPELWWTGAVNAGIREALGRGATTLILLNNDCYVTRDTLATLVGRANATDQSAIIAPLQRDARGGALLSNLFTTAFLLGFPTLQVPWPRDARPGDARLLPIDLIIGGRGALIPRPVLERVGLLDEEALPHYGADHDFYLRCRRAGTPLYLALDAFVDIDNARTSSARDSSRLSLRQFAASLADRRSHRNLRDLSTLFRRHYPIPGLHFVGVALNLIRFSLVYAASRLAYLLWQRHSHVR